MNENHDKTRQFIDLAITAGRIRQSPQTGYVHHCHFAKDEGLNDTIPLYENFLFALALLRTRTSDGMAEAKEFLSKLLCFQNMEEGDFKGNFPIYLHEYPQCKDRFTGTSLLLPIFWILKNFGVVLGNDLKQRLIKATEAILSHALRMHKVKPAPFMMALKMAAACKGLGELWQDSSLQKEGEDMLAALKDETEAVDFGSWFSPVQLGETLTCLQMAYSQISQSPWKNFLTIAAEYWHQYVCCYIGPAVKVGQWGDEPQTTMLDFYESLFFETYPYRAFVNQVIHLQSALVQPTTDILPKMSYPFIKEGKVADFKWRIVQEEGFGYSAIQKSVLPNPAMEKGFHPFYLSWGDRNRTFSFVYQGGNCTFVDYEVVSDGLDFIFYLSEPVQTDDREKSREITFYCDRHEDLKIMVKEQTATTFQLEDKVTIEDNRMSISLVFRHEDGDGRFLGHIMPVNRLAQLNNKGDQRFTVFDWQVSLRSVRRYTPCRIRAELRFRPKQNTK